MKRQANEGEAAENGVSPMNKHTNFEVECTNFKIYQTIFEPVESKQDQWASDLLSSEAAGIEGNNVQNDVI